MNIRLNERVEQLEHENTQAWKARDAERARIAGLDGYREGYKSGYNAGLFESILDKRSRSVSGIPFDKLDALLKLAHGGSPLANEITRWLIELRAAAKRAA